jgi:hypothetical protein
VGEKLNSELDMPLEVSTGDQISILFIGTIKLISAI